MNGPGIVDRSGLGWWYRKISFFNAVGQLKDNADNHARSDYRDTVKQTDSQGTVKHQWEHESDGKKHCFGSGETQPFPTLWPGHAMLTNPPEYDITEVVVELPLDNVQAIQRPQVKMLPAMKPQTWMMWRDTADNSQFYVGVMAGDIRIRVMDHIMLPMPYV